MWFLKSRRSRKRVLFALLFLTGSGILAGTAMLGANLSSLGDDHQQNVAALALLEAEYFEPATDGFSVAPMSDETGGDDGAVIVTLAPGASDPTPETAVESPELVEPEFVDDDSRPDTVTDGFDDEEYAAAPDTPPGGTGDGSGGGREGPADGADESIGRLPPAGRGYPMPYNRPNAPGPRIAGLPSVPAPRAAPDRTPVVPRKPGPPAIPIPALPPSSPPSPATGPNDNPATASYPDPVPTDLGPTVAAKVPSTNKAPGDANEWYSPGDSPGAETLSEFRLDGKTLIIEFVSTEPGVGFDVLHVDGTANLDYGKIVFAFIDGYQPEEDAMYQFLQAQELVWGEPGDVSFFYGVIDSASTLDGLHAPEDWDFYTQITDDSIFDIFQDDTDGRSRLIDGVNYLYDASLALNVLAWEDPTDDEQAVQPTSGPRPIEDAVSPQQIHAVRSPDGLLLLLAGGIAMLGISTISRGRSK